MKALFFVFMCAVAQSFSQDISGGMDWKTEEDFRAAEDQVVENILWLEKNPNINNDEKGKNVAAYILKWMSGCPYISIEISMENIGKLLPEESYQYRSFLLVAYIYGQTFYAIQNKDDENYDSKKETYRGVLGSLNSYNSIVRLKGEKAENDVMENYNALLEEDELEEYIYGKLEK